MTTDANESATQLDGGNAGSSETANGNGDQGSNATAADPLAGLDAGSREWSEKNGVKSIADAVTAARNAQSLIGKSVQLPGDDAKPEDWNKVFDRLGRPEKPDGYQFTLPDGLPEEMPVDEEFTKSFRDAAHAAGLTAKQAAALHGWYVDKSAGAFKANGEAMTAQAATATQELEKAFGGAKDTDAFKQAITITNRAINELGGATLVEGMKAAGLLGDGGVVLNPAIALAFHKAGKALFTEDSLERGRGASATDNPFKDGPDAGNITEQNRLIKADRAQAERLMRQAGHDPKLWGLTAAAA